MEGELTAHLTLGAVIVYFIEYLKRWPFFRMLTPETTTLNRVVSAALAGAAAIGIGWTYDGATGTLVVTGLTWGTIVAACWEWVKQYAVQQVLYDTAVAPRVVQVREATNGR